MSSVIDVNNLWIRYGTVEAVKGISFSIKDGEIVGYLGPNGAGKTSTVKTLVGMLRPTSGTVLINGMNIVDNTIEVQRKLGVVPENAPAYTLLTVKEYLELVGELYEMEISTINKRLTVLLESFDLANSATKLVGTLSKGQRQKLVISAALLHDPQILILDEPLSGLDANAAKTVKELIINLSKQSRAILFCSHSLEVVERICDRVIILHQGVIVADSPTSQLVALSKKKTLESVFSELTDGEKTNETVSNLLKVL